MAHALSFEGTDLRHEPEKVQAILLGTSPSSSSWHINLMLMVLVKWALEQWAGEEAWLSSWCWALATPFPASLLSGSFSLPLALSSQQLMNFSLVALILPDHVWPDCPVIFLSDHVLPPGLCPEATLTSCFSGLTGWQKLLSVHTSSQHCCSRDAQT